MSKPPFQDIVPARKSIRDIPIPSHRMPPPSAVTHPPSDLPHDFDHDDNHYESPTENTMNEKSGFKKYAIFIVVLLVILAGLFGAATIFDGATVKITPKKSVEDIDLTLKASKDSSEPLRFNLITIDKQGSKTVTASTTNSVEKKAAGTITVYNNYNEQNQVLVKNTRFENSDGVIFRTQEQITVPGKKTENGMVVPGQIDAYVVADIAGDKYNLTSGTFTIPGFKSDPARYAAFSAKLKEPFTGGFIGIAPVISASVKDAAVKALVASLQDELKTEVAKQVPETYVFFPSGISYQTTVLPDTVSGTNVNVNVKETVYGLIFKKEDLTTFLASKSIENFDATKEKVDTQSLANLNFNFTSNTALNASSTNAIEFSLKGQTTFIYQFDTTAFKNEIMGKDKEAIERVITKSYPSIERFKVVIRPFWSSKMPNDPSKIILDISS